MVISIIFEKQNYKNLHLERLVDFGNLTVLYQNTWAAMIFYMKKFLKIRMSNEHVLICVTMVNFQAILNFQHTLLLHTCIAIIYSPVGWRCCCARIACCCWGVTVAVDAADAGWKQQYADSFNTNFNQESKKQILNWEPPKAYTQNFQWMLHRLKDLHTYSIVIASLQLLLLSDHNVTVCAHLYLSFQRFHHLTENKR